MVMMYDFDDGGEDDDDDHDCSILVLILNIIWCGVGGGCCVY
jgi:hypothetical protein